MTSNTPLESKKEESSLADTVLLWIFWIAVLTWLAYVFYSPYKKLDDQEVTALDKPRTAVLLALAVRLPDATEVRVEPRGGNNLEIYMNPDSDFERHCFVLIS